MEELAKKMKVIRLSDELCGSYLTASDDMMSINLTRPDMEGWEPKNTEWRIEWLNRCKNTSFVGQVRLWSIYDKALSLIGDPADYTSRATCKEIFQADLAALGSQAKSAAEWRFELRRKSNRLAVEMFRWSNKAAEMRVLTIHVIPDSSIPTNIIRTLNLSFGQNSRNRFLKWFNGPSWIVDVIEIAREEQRSNELAQSGGIGLNHVAKKHQRHHEEENNRDHKNTTTSPMVTGPASSPGYRRDGEFMMGELSRWQVGQVYITLPPIAEPTANGYYNSGGNHNGSGVQRNGDVTISNEIGRSRDSIATFVNHDR